MSLFKPKDGDYITRGLTLFLVWAFVGMPGMALLGLLASHSLGGAFVGLLAAVVLSVVGYWAYLKFGEREMDRKREERLKMAVKERRIRLEMQMRGYKW